MDNQGFCQGIYEFNGVINGQSSWKKDDEAIWFYQKKSEWQIGKLENIGIDFCGIYGPASQDQSILAVANDKWKFFHDDKWKSAPSGDIIIKFFTGIIFTSISTIEGMTRNEITQGSYSHGPILTNCC